MQPPLEIWIAFNAFVLVMIVLDLFVLNRHNKVISIRRALMISGIWISLALIFCYGIDVTLGHESALNFLTGYLIEEALSIDNLFVFLMLFKYFHTPPQYQYKVLFWGIIGALIMRACFIFFGIALFNTFHWIIYIFGAALIYAGIQMAMPKSETVHPENNPVIILMKKWLPITPDYQGQRFFIRHLERWYATPLFIVLVAVETSDLIFAVDSIPAVMAITRDPFIVYTSNIFALLGLRSLFFALSGIMNLFHFLHYGLAAILIFVGLKMILEPFLTISIGIALGFIVLTISFVIIASLLFPKNINGTAS